jgi:hypothetical protein
MEARGVVSQAVDVQKMEEAVGEAVDQSGDHGIPAQSEGLLDQPAKEELLADGSEAHGQQGDHGKSGCGRHDAEHLVELEAVAKADAPDVELVAVDGHPNPEKEETHCHTGQGAEDQGDRRNALSAQADVPPALAREEEKRQRPHDQDMKQEQDVGLRGTERRIEAGGQDRQHQQREQPRWDGEPLPAWTEEAGGVQSFRAHENRSLLQWGNLRSDYAPGGCGRVSGLGHGEERKSRPWPEFGITPVSSAIRKLADFFQSLVWRYPTGTRAEWRDAFCLRRSPGPRSRIAEDASRSAGPYHVRYTPTNRRRATLRS